VEEAEEGPVPQLLAPRLADRAHAEDPLGRQAAEEHLVDREGGVADEGHGVAWFRHSRLRLGNLSARRAGGGGAAAGGWLATALLQQHRRAARFYLRIANAVEGGISDEIGCGNTANSRERGTKLGLRSPEHGGGGCNRAKYGGDPIEIEREDGVIRELTSRRRRRFCFPSRAYPRVRFCPTTSEDEDEMVRQAAGASFRTGFFHRLLASVWAFNWVEFL